ncbi:HD domain-containing protein [Micromonospora sp. WMMD1082]|uniref:HD domain-containing protein n=1 Tax=Micromonospora sp. WMMD1082 TaxID=3016104 RepID=UPI00241787BC|nr:HD domain-containing protein [Micromonospora sp. WMMD1082]MDG4795446.1 HD domain-containing protein [Micromonospora sp. WMMD1082]
MTAAARGGHGSTRPRGTLLRATCGELAPMARQAPFPTGVRRAHVAHRARVNAPRFENSVRAMTATGGDAVAMGWAATTGPDRDTARQLLETQLPRRWRHVQAVAAKAERISAAVPVDDRQVLVASAWLHDIGYSPDLVDTGFHPLDGGRWLRRAHHDDRVAALVAHHSCAWLEAEERGLDKVLTAEFAREDTPVTDALCFCDLTTGPDGQDFEVHARLAEIRSRYGAGHVVTRFIVRAEPEIVAAVQRTERRLAGTTRQPT